MSSTTLIDNVVDQSFLSDVVDGLSRKQKVLPCKYFYDEKGSLLFEAICETPEYYVTRTEMDIYRRYAEQMSAFIGENVLLIEPGAGSIKKVSLILDELKNPAGFIPMDISPEILQASSRILEKRFPELDITPLVVDFLDESALKAIFATMPAAPLVDKRVIFFPGSTIGNFSPVDAKQFLGHFYDNLQAGDGLLIGVDLVKNAQVLEAAYDDQKGVTADFNLNLLHRINDELKGEFKLENFAHKALFNSDDSRIEMHIVSTEDQQVAIAEQHFSFEQGETIHTESSYKYTTADFVALAAEVGFQSEKVWVDDEQLFSVHYFTVPS